MAKENGLSRRDFTVAAALAALSGVAITISACGGGGSPTSSSGSGTTGGTTGGGTTSGTASGDKVGVISANHGHTATVTGAQLTAGGAVKLDIRGSSDHPHTLELTAADIASIAAGNKVTRESTTDSGHSHDVTFN